MTRFVPVRDVQRGVSVNQLLDGKTQKTDAEHKRHLMISSSLWDGKASE